MLSLGHGLITEGYWLATALASYKKTTPPIAFPLYIHYPTNNISPEDWHLLPNMSDSSTYSIPLEREKTYTYEGLQGWKSVRVLRLGRGMYHDVRRRLPYYRSDITDAFTYRTVASIVRMYFVKSVPPLHLSSAPTANKAQHPPGNSIHTRHEPPDGQLLRHQ